MKLKTGTIYVYYDFPIVFSAKNEEGDIFVCLFADETDTHLRYFCREVSFSVLAALESNRMDVRSVFESYGKLYALCLNAQSEERVEAVETFEDIAPFLPEKGFFLGGGEGKMPQAIHFPIRHQSPEITYDFGPPIAYYTGSPTPKYGADAGD